MIEWAKVFDQIERIQIKSVTDSLFKTGLWILAIGSLVAGFGHAPNWVLVVVFVLGGLFFCVGLGAYIYFARRNPEYLRSETHQQKMRVIDLLGDKDNADNPNVIHLPAMTNPNISIKPDLAEGSTKSIEG